MKLISFGEILWDVYPDQAYIGGAPLNFAAHAAKQGATVSMLSAVGRDSLGDKALDRLRAWQIDTSLVSVLDDKPTGQCLVTLDQQSVPSYQLIEDVAWDAIQADPESIPACDALYFGTLSLRGEHNRQTLKQVLDTGRFSDVLVDVNLRAPFYDQDSIRFALERATILKISDEELTQVLTHIGCAVTDDLETVARTIVARYPGVRLLIVTCGGDGAFAYDSRTDTPYRCPAVSAQVVSTVGAGDSFTAAFWCRYHDTGDVAASLAYAARVAAFVVSHYDAVPDYTLEDIS